jgi:gas vesicle protein
MTSSGNPEPTGERSGPPRGKPYRNVTDARSVSMLGVGMVIGAVIGAGIALLVAPASGHETRRLLSHRAGRLRGNPGVWGKLGRELRRAAAAKRKALEIEARQREVELRRAAAAKV